MVGPVTQMTAIEKSLFSWLPRGGTVKLCRVPGEEMHWGRVVGGGRERGKLGQGGFTEGCGEGTGEAGSVEQDGPV